MSMNIKNKEAHQLTEELAKLTGESLTAAVTEAVRERLDRVRQAKGVNLGKDCAAHLKKPFSTIDHGEMLYDDRGLPK
jgi:antitoxin VapB